MSIPFVPLPHQLGQGEPKLRIERRRYPKFNELDREVIEQECLFKRPSDVPYENYARMLYEGMKKHAMTAIEKETREELTEDECCAICFFGGVRYQFDSAGKMVFEKAGISKIDGKWHVFTAAPSATPPQARPPRPLA